MILADDNFATIVAAVREGRGIFANIRKFLRFLLSSNIGEVLTMFFGVVLARPLGLDDTGEAIAVPLLATQILWINLLTDTAPALAMGLDPPPDDVMTAPAARLGDRVIDREMWIGIVWVGSSWPSSRSSPSTCGSPGGRRRRIAAASTRRARWRSPRSCSPSCSTASTPARTVRSAFHRLFTNRWLWAAIALSIVLQVAVVQLSFLNEAFGTTPLSVERLGDLRRARQRRAVGRRSEEAGRPPPAGSGVGDRTPDDERLADVGLELRIARIGNDLEGIERLREEAPRGRGQHDVHDLGLRQAEAHGVASGCRRRSRSRRRRRARRGP